MGKEEVGAEEEKEADGKGEGEEEEAAEQGLRVGEEPRGR